MGETRACRFIESSTTSSSSVYAYELQLDAWWNEGSHPQSALIAERYAGPNRRPTLVVLPLRNLSGNPEQDYFSDGMTEELIGELDASIRISSPSSHTPRR